LRDDNNAVHLPSATKTLWLFRLASNALGYRLEKRFQKILESVAGVTNRCTFAAQSRDRRKEEKFFTYWFKKQECKKSCQLSLKLIARKKQHITMESLILAQDER
jgi:hypothetical protein